LIGSYEPEFDKEFVSKYKALERLLPSNIWKKEKGALWKSHKISKEFLEVYDIKENDLNKVQQDILDEWEKINKESCERGTKIHAQLENSFYNAGNNVTLKKFGIGGKFQCKKNYSDLDLEYGVYPEYLIYYDNPKIDLHIAGQIDLLIKDGNDIICGDHKTNRKIDFKGFYDSSVRSEKKMKYPLTNLGDCNFNHYQLQLSTYAWMLQKLNPNFNIKRLFINHYDHEGNNNIYEVQYLKDDVERMLKHFAKQQKLKKQKSKYERIEY
jgi:ATP-dependent exoDNAse (exonuclease V) beta subunit